MTIADMEAIVGGYHGDPFRVLGPHRMRRLRGKPRWEVRAFLPHAESADLLIGDSATPMAKSHEHGFFCLQLDG